MALPLEQWLKTVEKYKDYTVAKMSQEVFFRDPGRIIHQDRTCFFAPADGTIIYQEVVKGKDAICEVKGKKFTLGELMGDKEFTLPCLVIGIFMSAYDVHINRMPMDGAHWFHHIDNINTNNLPMLFEEKKIFDGYLAYDKMNYLHGNSRMWNKVVTTHLNYEWYMVQIADSDVNLVLPFNQMPGYHYCQNERFSMVRFGSQTDLILPLYKGLDFELLQKPMMHVEAGVDRLVRIKEK